MFDTVVVYGVIWWLWCLLY